MPQFTDQGYIALDQHPHYPPRAGRWADKPEGLDVAEVLTLGPSPGWSGRGTGPPSSGVNSLRKGARTGASPLPGYAGRQRRTGGQSKDECGQARSSAWAIPLRALSARCFPRQEVGRSPSRLAGHFRRRHQRSDGPARAPAPPAATEDVVRRTAGGDHRLWCPPGIRRSHVDGPHCAPAAGATPSVSLDSIQETRGPSWIFRSAQDEDGDLPINDDAPTSTARVNARRDCGIESNPLDKRRTPPATTDGKQATSASPTAAACRFRRVTDEDRPQQTDESRIPVTSP